MPDEPIVDAPQTPTPETPPTVPQRPTDVPDKFWDAERGTLRTDVLLKSYGELEKKQGQSKDGPLSLKKSDPVADKLKGDDATVDTVLEAAGIAPVDILGAFQKDGKATDEQYAALAKLGYGKGLVNQIYGQLATYAKSSMDAAVKEAEGLAGGRDKLDVLLRFGGDLPEPQFAKMQKRLNDPAEIAGAVRELLQIHREAVGAGKANALITGESGPSSAVIPYASKTDFMRGANEAKTSSEARNKHIARLGATTNIDALPMK